MILTINGTEYDIVGYDTYLDDYSKAAKPECRDDGEQEFENALEEILGGGELKHGGEIEVTIPREKASDERRYRFFFSVFLDCVTILSYVGCDIRH